MSMFSERYLSDMDVLGSLTAPLATTPNKPCGDIEDQLKVSPLLSSATYSSDRQAMVALLPVSSGERHQVASLPSTTILITASRVCDNADSTVACSDTTTYQLPDSISVADSSASPVPPRTPAKPSNKPSKTEKVYCCPYDGCQMSFLRQYRLKVHLRSHNENRPFTCEYPGCGASFYERSKLNRHKQKHAEAQHQCDICGARFRQASNMRRHTVTVHGGVGQFPSPPPPPTPPLFPTDHFSLALSDDSASKVSVPAQSYWCELCDRRFCRKIFYLRHRCPAARLPAATNLPEVNHFRCTHTGCDFTASTRGALTVHRRRHALKRFRCLRPNCSWSFLTLAKLRRHQLQHTFRRDFACPVAECHRRYRRLEYLVRHIRSTHRAPNTTVSALSRNSLSCHSDDAGLLKSGTSDYSDKTTLANMYTSQPSSAERCSEHAASGVFSSLRHNKTKSGTKVLSGCLRALGVGRIPCYLQPATGERNDGAILCSRTDLIYCSSARVSRHSMPSYFSSEQSDQCGSSVGHLVPTVAPSGLTNHNRRSTKRSALALDSSAESQENLYQSQENLYQHQESSCGSNPSSDGLLFPMDHVFSEEADVLMDSFSLFSDDPLRVYDSSSITSTINLNDLA